MPPPITQGGHNNFSGHDSHLEKEVYTFFCELSNDYNEESYVVQPRQYVSCLVKSFSQLVSTVRIVYATQTERTYAICERCFRTTNNIDLSNN